MRILFDVLTHCVTNQFSNPLPDGRIIQNVVP
jgi:hypothetical protein